jgi:hypothetical protein
MEKTEFEFPDEVQENPREGGKVVAVEEPEIEIVDDTPPEDQNRKPMEEPPKEVTDDELNKYDESVQKRIKHLSKGYHEERREKEKAFREREEAVKLAQSVIEENKKLQGSLSQGHSALLEQAKKVISNELDQAKRKYKEAYESGDSDALVNAQDELTNIKLKAEKVNNFRVAPLQTQENNVQIPQTRQEVDPKLRAWQDENQWFGSNRGMTAYALGLHEDLVAEGIPVGSDQYYQRINSDVKKRFPDVFESENPDASPPKKSNIVAPATRSTAPKKVVLTKSQVEIAKRLGVPLELYAKKVAEEMRK